jgi:hypothetical protein
MSHFCFQASQAQQLQKISLNIGQEAPPVLWRETGPAENVHGVFFRQDATLIFVDEASSSIGPPTSFRELRLTGRRPGAGQFVAVEVPRVQGLNTLGQVQVDVRDVDDKEADLTYSGRFVYWHRAVPESLKGASPLLFPATSGLPGSQSPLFQKVPFSGPLPEGLYVFFTHIDPLQNSVEVANRRGDDAISNRADGIQFLPVGGNGPTRPEWGTFRTQLTPVRGAMHGRKDFYLHDSRKGFSHGCIEVGKSSEGVDFFSALLGYAAERTRKPRLILRVKYSHPAQITRGTTAAT